MNRITEGFAKEFFVWFILLNIPNEFEMNQQSLRHSQHAISSRTQQKHKHAKLNNKINERHSKKQILPVKTRTTTS